MTLAEGYKDTELGPIPQDWDLATIAEVVQITTGSRNTQDKVEDGQFPFFVRSQTVERINSFSYDGEAVLTAGDGVGTGKIFHYINGPFDCHQRVYRMSGFGDRMDGFYFYKFFSAAFYDRIMSMTAKSSVDSVRREMIADMAMPVPPIGEQKAIAEALRDIDDLVASLDALIAKKRDIKQAAMQQLLTGKTRLPGFSRQWRQSTLGDVLWVRHGRDQKAIQCDDGCFPILATGGEIGRTNTPLYTRPSVLIGRKGTIDRPQYMDQPFWTVDTLFYTEIQGLNSALYLFYVFQAVDWRSYNEASGVPSLSAKTIEAIPVKMPEPDEQAEIAATLADFDREIDGLEQRSTKFRALREGTMQQLLTGRIRLV